ncbi:MAG: BON domain-containing protein [Ginsengibacter sp.]
MKLTKIFLAVFLSSAILFFSCKPKDADVQTKITQQFAAKPDCAGASATVTDGVATLTGEVKDDACKNLAESTAKDVKGVKSVVNNLTTTPPPAVVTAPAVSSDNALTQGVTDATKDFPDVTATVNNGEVTLTGSIKRADLTKLIQTLNTLKPTKINNQLTIK